MCLEAMVTEGKLRRIESTGAERPKLFKSTKRQLLYPCVVKAAIRKYTTLCEKSRRINRKSSRKPGRRSGLSLSTAWEKPKHADVFPSGAMAPRNTTQYLMDLVYADLLNVSTQFCETEPSVFDLSRQSNDVSSPQGYFHQSAYSSPFTYDETMDFQRRDFENVFFLNEI